MLGAVLPFHIRLQDLLERQGPDATQSWLADRTGLDRSLISRVIRGDRPPTPETIQCLAPALGVGVLELVAGTDAEARLEAGSDTVRRSHYEAAVAKVIEYEGVIRDLEDQVRGLGDALAKEESARKAATVTAAAAEKQADADAARLAELQTRHEAQGRELVHHQQALARAVAAFTGLQKQVVDLQAELAETKKSSKAAALLAGVGAVTSAASLAYFLGTDPPRTAASHGTPRRSSRSKR